MGSPYTAEQVTRVAAEARLGKSRRSPVQYLVLNLQVRGSGTKQAASQALTRLVVREPAGQEEAD